MSSSETAPTLALIAERCGVSTSAASLALRGKAGVSAETRRRIIEEAGAMGYRGRAAAPLTTSTTIGLLLKSRPGDQGNVNAFYGPVVGGITESARAAGISVLLDSLPVDDDYRPIDLPQLVSGGTTSGLIVLGAYLSNEASEALGNGPIVLVDGYSADPDRHVSVVTDNVAGARRATEHLIAHGHREIALVGTAIDAFPSIRGRRNGYRAAMEAADLAERYVDHHYERAAECADLLVDAIGADPSITAAVCANDTVALACIAALRAARIDVPGDISLVGYDDLDAAALVSPGLDTMAIDQAAMGRLAVRLLQHQIDAPDDPRVVAMQRPRLVRRQSVAAPGR